MKVFFRGIFSSLRHAVINDEGVIDQIYFVEISMEIFEIR